MATHIWEMAEYSDWGEPFDAVAGTEWRKLCDLPKQHFLGGVRPCLHEGSAGILLYFRLALQRVIAEKNLTKQYDTFVVSRTDHLYKCNHSLLFLSDLNKVWHFEGEGYGGVTDRHFVVSANKVLQVLNVTYDLLVDPNIMMEYAKNRDQPINLEVLTMDWYMRNRIEWTSSLPRTAFTVRGKDDPTRWSKGEFVHGHGLDDLKVKYMEEYKTTMLNCKS